MGEWSHYDEKGAARMVDVGPKQETERVARAQAVVQLQSATLERLKDLKKGDPFQAARIAGIQAAKKTADLIPLCHPLLLTCIGLEIEPEPENQRVRIIAEVRCSGKTGVEMEALTAAAVAALTFYDMCKALDKEMTITDICLLEKSGGRSGDFMRGKS